MDILTAEEFLSHKSLTKDYTHRFFYNESPSYNINTDISNVWAQLYFVNIEDQWIPIAIPDSDKPNCYVCSPYSHYIVYAREEVELISSRTLRFISKLLIKFLDHFYTKINIDDVVYINNWFLSTNLYPKLSNKVWIQLIKVIKEKFPTKTIMLRSLNEQHHKDLINTCLKLGFKKIASRQIYCTEPWNPSIYKKRDYKNDKKLFERSEYKVLRNDDFSTQNIDRILGLYNQLYLDKYTNLNPHFTSEFIYKAIKSDTFFLMGLEKEGRIDAILGYFIREQIMTTPLFGYDLSVSPKEGLYRLLSFLLLKESEDKNLILNQSSGAGPFKLNRGAQKIIEYNLYDDSSANKKQRRGWKILNYLATQFFEPMLRKKDF
ncbi:hypothetical protein [Spirochaeta cellobiosiphila]|uniref:hypothetical protein n=1 Tax=Spirochaeta cellobiosiphila TaxID=504483 RepID=UPI000416C350|nr:hypothetical protein [Spirochaeta cellobiosiphila]